MARQFSLPVNFKIAQLLFPQTTNAAGGSVHSGPTPSDVVVNVFDPPSFSSSLTVVPGSITGGSASGTLSFGIPNLGASVTSATLVDNGANPVLERGRGVTNDEETVKWPRLSSPSPGR